MSEPKAYWHTKVYLIYDIDFHCGVINADQLTEQAFQMSVAQTLPMNNGLYQPLL